MKKSLLLIVFITFSIIGYSQNYIPLVDTNSIWKISWNFYPPPPEPAYSDYYRYSITDDTIFNDTIYKKLYMVQMDLFCSKIVLDSLFIGGIREEISEKKVYFIQDANSGEHLLYDFTLDVGDTVPNTLNNYAYPELIVSAIDSILCADKYRKRYIYSRDTWAPIEVIEGIGAYTGLLERMEIFEHNSTLRCFYNDDSLIYMNPFINSCNLEMDTCFVTEISETAILLESVLVYPNPAIKNATITIINPQGKLQDYYLSIFDSMGKLKHRNSFHANSIAIRDKNFETGVYYYSVYREYQKISSGILIMK